MKPHLEDEGSTFPELEIAFQPVTDVVEVVSFRPSQKVTMEDIIARYGKPDAVLVTVRHQYPRTGMLLKYAELRFDVALAEQEGSIFEIDASTEVERIAYLSMAAYSSARPTIDSLPTWKGYGEYQEYIPRGQ